MNKPKMILFDYGHTLMYEPEFDFLQGEKEIYKHIVKNPKEYTVEECCKFGIDLFKKIYVYRNEGFELHDWQFLKLKYEYLCIELDISYAEAERILFDSMTGMALMPNVEEMLEYLSDTGIRSGVISNIGWSGDSLISRINKYLPNNQFEFIIASSEYGIRKPDPIIFELALQKANLEASDVWFCGDNIKADIYGAKNAGIYPVFYNDKTLDNPWVNQDDNQTLDFEHLRIHDWKDMIHILKTTS